MIDRPSTAIAIGWHDGPRPRIADDLYWGHVLGTGRGFLGETQGSSRRGAAGKRNSRIASLREAGSPVTLIENVWGVGYRLVGELPEM
jgi:hypothetical protein